jgi:streptothricin acetyltransferase
VEILIEEATAGSSHLLNQVNGDFVVDSRMSLHAKDGEIHYSIVPVPRYTRRYAINPTDYSSFIEHPDQAVYLAYLDRQLAGQIALKVFWNGFGYVDDFVVDSGFRQKGVGRALMEKGIEWARGKNLPGLMLETQDVNVNACRFYERMGFELSGFDRFLYRETLPGSVEMALFWDLLC